MRQESELPVLAGIGALLRWLEELLVMASGPVLTFGLGVGLVALLTDGQLLVSAPWLIYAWGVAMAVGVDGQLIGAAVKGGRAFRAGKWWHVAGYLVIIGALSYVAYLAAIVFATAQADGISTAHALALLGMDKTDWITQRSAVVVALVILSGVLRYDPVKPAAETAAQRAERQARELAEAEHKNAMLAARWGGLARAGRTAVASAIHDTTPTQSGDNGSANLVQEDEGTDGQSADDGEPEARPLRARERGRSAAPTGLMSAPEFAQYLRESGVSITDEAARAIVKTERGFAQRGTTYYADKRALKARANRMINQAHPTIQLVG